MTNNEKNMNTVISDENLQDVNGARSPYTICPCCHATFYVKDGHKYGGKLYCDKCWRFRDKLGSKGVFPTQQGAEGSW